MNNVVETQTIPEKIMRSLWSSNCFVVISENPTMLVRGYTPDNGVHVYTLATNSVGKRFDEQFEWALEIDPQIYRGEVEKSKISDDLYVPARAKVEKPLKNPENYGIPLELIQTKVPKKLTPEPTCMRNGKIEPDTRVVEVNGRNYMVEIDYFLLKFLMEKLPDSAFLQYSMSNSGCVSMIGSGEIWNRLREEIAKLPDLQRTLGSVRVYKVSFEKSKGRTITRDLGKFGFPEEGWEPNLNESYWVEIITETTNFRDFTGFYTLGNI